MGNTVNVNLGSCPYCDGQVDYEISFYKYECDYGTEYDACSILACNKDKCVLNYFDGDFYSEWDSYCTPTRIEELTDKYLRKAVRNHWRRFKLDLLYQRDSLLDICQKLIKESELKSIKSDNTLAVLDKYE